MKTDVPQGIEQLLVGLFEGAPVWHWQHMMSSLCFIFKFGELFLTGACFIFLTFTFLAHPFVVPSIHSVSIPCYAHRGVDGAGGDIPPVPSASRGGGATTYWLHSLLAEWGKSLMKHHGSVLGCNSLGSGDQRGQPGQMAFYIFRGNKIFFSIITLQMKACLLKATLPNGQLLLEFLFSFVRFCKYLHKECYFCWVNLWPIQQFCISLYIFWKVFITLVALRVMSYFSILWTTWYFIYFWTL